MAVSSQAAPQNFLDGKTRRSVNKIIEKFKFQPNPNSCLPNGLYNILNELARLHTVNALGFSEAKVNKICLYKSPTGPDLNNYLRRLNNEIKSLGYIAIEKPNSTYNQLSTVLEDTDCSYPLIVLSSKYLEDELQIKLPNVTEFGYADHVVVLLLSDKYKSVIFDPYAGINIKIGQNQQGLNRGIALLSTSRLTELWEEAFDMSCMIWIKKEKNKSGELDRYFNNSEIPK